MNALCAPFVRIFKTIFFVCKQTNTDIYRNKLNKKEEVNQHENLIATEKGKHPIPNIPETN